MLGAVQTRSTNTNISVSPQAILQTRGETEPRSLEFIYMHECTLNASQKTLLKSRKFGGRKEFCVTKELPLQPFISHP